MAVTRRDPGTIWLGGPLTKIGDYSAKAAFTPGHLVERVNTAGEWQWQKHATAGGAAGRYVALENAMVNKGVDDAYVANELAQVGEGAGGTEFWMFIASGQNISFGDKLESAGDGTLRILSSGVALFGALESPGAVTALTRLRVEVI